MHLGETIEFNHSDCSVGAEAIPLVNVIRLSNIWLPSHLLQRPKKFMDTNSNKPSIFHTLEKPADCFSTYSDPNLQSNKTVNCSLPVDDSSDDFSHADMLDILNDYSPTSAAENINEVPNNKNLIPYSESASHLQNCPPDQQLTVCNSCSTNNIFDSKEQFHVAEEAGHFSKDLNICEQLNTNHITYDKTVLDSLTDSLEEIYNSADEEVNPSTILEDTSVCNLVPSNSIPDHSPNLLCNQFEGLEIKSQKNVVESKIEDGQLNINECSNVVEHCLKNSELDENLTTEKPDSKAESENHHMEDLTKYPIAYRRPMIEETLGKQKIQKERKKKKTYAKNMLLSTFLSKDNFNDYEEPVVDEFYEQVMRKKRHQSYAAEYPSWNDSQNSYVNNSKVNICKEPEMSCMWEKDSPLTMTDYQIATSSEELNMKEEVKTELNKGNENVCTIMIENIPPAVTKKQVQSLMSAYGELKQLSLVKCGDFLKANMKMDSICNVDWIIECLNGKRPFGTTSEALKCYKLCWNSGS